MNNLQLWIIKSILVRAQYKYKDRATLKAWSEIVKLCHICDAIIEDSDETHDKCKSCKHWVCYEHLDREQISGDPLLCDVCSHICSFCGFISNNELSQCNAYECGKSMCDKCKAPAFINDCTCNRNDYDCCKKCFANDMCIMLVLY